MALAVDLYHFPKRPNSTKVPDESTEVTHTTCVLKDDTSIISPTLEFSFGNSVVVPNANYCGIPEMGRFYFIRDWVSVGMGLWTCTCDVDVCGSYRSDVLKSNQFVERAERFWDGNLVDALAMSSAVAYSERTAVKSPWFGAEYTYVVGVTGVTTYYYAMSESSFKEFWEKLFSDDYAETVIAGFGDIYPELKAQLDPLQYISSVRAYPMSIGGTGTVGRIPVGWGIVNGVSAQLIPANMIHASQYDIVPPKHPQANDFPFVVRSPFSEISIYFPPFGDISIDPAVVASRDNVTCIMRVDFNTGIGVLTLLGGSGVVIIGETSAPVGINLEIGHTYSVGYGLGNSVSDISGVTLNAMTGNINGVINGVSDSIKNMVGSLTPKFRSVGSNSGGANFSGEIIANGVFQRIVSPDKHFFGRPLYATTPLVALTGGFIMCRNAELDINGLETETTRLENYLNGGVYLE